MPQSAALSLQKAIYTELVTDHELLSLLGGAFVYDHTPQGTLPPYISLNSMETRVLLTGDGEQEEHLITLHIWSEEPGRKQIWDALSIIRNKLHDQSLTLENHVLVNMQLQSSETRRNRINQLYQGIARYRAVTEPELLS